MVELCPHIQDIRFTAAGALHESTSGEVIVVRLLRSSFATVALIMSSPIE